MKKLSVIIPAYNEEDRIVPTIMQLHRFLNEKDYQFEIIVADDGSVDQTVAVVNNLKQQMFQLSVLKLEHKGKGYAVRQGLLAATGDICMFTDADGSTPADQLDKLLVPLLKGDAAVAIGSRYHRDADVVKAQPGMRVLWSRLVNRAVQRLLLPGIADPHCGFKAFIATAVKPVFSQCRTDGWSFDLEALAIARRLEFGIAEVPVTWINDERSKAKIRHLPQELYSFWQIRKRLAAKVVSRNN